MEKIKNHSLLIENGRITLTGVVKALGSNDREISVELSGTRLIIEGSEINIDTLDLEAGRLSASGTVKTVKYLAAHEKQALLKRLFK